MDQTASKSLPLTGLQRPISLLHYDYKSITFHLQRSLIVQTHPRIQGKSLYFFLPDNRLRKMLCRATESWIFEVIIILLIIASSVILAFEHPLDDPESEMIKQLKMADMVITIIFIIEALAKIIVSGFILNGRHSYLMDSWNLLDFIIVSISTASLFVNNTSI